MLFVAFALVAFNVLSLSLVFVNVVTVCLGVSLWVSPAWDFCASWTWLTISFPMLGTFSAFTSSNIFSGPFSLLLLCYGKSLSPVQLFGTLWTVAS